MRCTLSQWQKKVLEVLKDGKPARLTEIKDQDEEKILKIYN